MEDLESYKKLGQEFIDKLWTYSRDGTSNSPWNIDDWITDPPDIGLTYSNLDLVYLSNSNFISDMATLSTLIQNGCSTDPNWYNQALIGAVNTADKYPQGVFSTYLQIDLYHFVNYWASITMGPNDGIFPTLKKVTMSFITYNKKLNTSNSPSVFFIFAIDGYS